MWINSRLPLRLSPLLLGLLAMVGCTPTDREPTEPIDALLVEPSAAGRAALVDAATRLTGSSQLILAEDAFIQRSQITIERTSHRSLEGDPASGRMTERPQVLSLQRYQGQCRLLHLGTGKAISLPEINCLPEE